MKKIFFFILKSILFLGIGFYLIIILFGFAVNSGITNSESKEIFTLNSKNNETKNNNDLKTEILNKFTNIDNTGTINENNPIIAPDDIINAKRRYILYRLSSEKLIDSKMVDYLEKNPEDIPGVLISYDSFNDTNYYDKFTNYENEYLKNIKTLSSEKLLSYITATNRAYVEEKLRNNRVNSFISKDLLNNQQFTFVFNGIKNHSGIKQYLSDLSSKLNIDKEYVLSCIMTEQTRYSITQRGNVKKYLKSIPFLFSYTYGSKGIGGIKDFTAINIANASIKGGYGDIFVKSKNNDLNNPYWEVVYPTYLVKNILTKRNNAGYPINDQPGIVATLYNFGNPDNKVPNAEPKIGGSVIQITDTKSLTFGELGRNFYYYFKIYGF